MGGSVVVRRRWLVATLLYVATIFVVSSRPYLRAPGPEFDFKDKLAHAVEYGILAALLWRAAAPAFGRERWLAALALIAVVASVAAADEVFQGTIPGRLTDVGDWLADVTGASVAVTIGALRSARRPDLRAATE